MHLRLYTAANKAHLNCKKDMHIYVKRNGLAVKARLIMVY